MFINIRLGLLGLCCLFLSENIWKFVQTKKCHGTVLHESWLWVRFNCTCWHLHPFPYLKSNWMHWAKIWCVLRNPLTVFFISHGICLDHPTSMKASYWFMISRFYWEPHVMMETLNCKLYVIGSKASAVIILNLHLYNLWASLLLKELERLSPGLE